MWFSSSPNAGLQPLLKPQATRQLSARRLTLLHSCANFTVVIFDGLVRTSEVADRAGRSVQTVHRWVDQELIVPAGKFPGKTGSYLFREEDVIALLDRIGQPA